jgi:hypothetical protein
MVAEQWIREEVDGVMAYSWCFHGIFPKWLWKITKLRIFGVPTEPRTEYFLNTSLECYGYAYTIGMIRHLSRNSGGCFCSCFIKFCVHMYARSSGFLGEGNFMKLCVGRFFLDWYKKPIILDSYFIISFFFHWSIPKTNWSYTCPLHIT